MRERKIVVASHASDNRNPRHNLWPLDRDERRLRRCQLGLAQCGRPEHSTTPSDRTAHYIIIDITIVISTAMNVAFC